MQISKNSILNLFYKMPQNLGGAFRGNAIFWQLLAFALTSVCVVTGFDWYYYVHLHDSAIAKILFPAVGIGFLVPILLPVILMLLGAIRKNSSTLLAGYATAQASFLGWLFSAAYKSLTGRSGPPGEAFSSFSIDKVQDISHVFKFGFLRGGIFWGWPSSHTMTSFSLSFALVALFPNNKSIRYIAIAYALYIGLGVSMSIHWFSDFAAGAIFGTLVGLSVGKSFYNKLKSYEV